MAVDVDVGGGRGGVVEAYLFFALLLECNKIFNAQAGTGGGGGGGGVVEYTRATSVSVITWPGGFFCCCFFIIGEKKTTVKKKKKNRAEFLFCGPVLRQESKAAQKHEAF